ncbi:hypothetical protein [Endozoicomonas sp. ALB122]|uniref:hypothetical protein n=1 Tax=Endozoicomonas sp. ALB122 TaxID=3403075 RepID=UPI003BB7B0F1
MDSRLRGNDENEAGNDENEAGNDENEAGNDGSQLVPRLERVLRHPQSGGDIRRERRAFRLSICT